MTRQSDLYAGLLDPNVPTPTGLTGPKNGPSHRRYDVYRNNVTHSLIAALNSAFPFVRKLIGGQKFDRLAPIYARKHPPSTPLMMHYGADLPNFLETYDPLHSIGYLPDAARLDLAMRASYHAADAKVLTPERLGQMAETTLGARSFQLAPASIIIRSSWPLYDIWRFTFEADAPKPVEEPQDVLITRPAFDPEPHKMPPGAAAWCAALASGQTFDTAHQTACDQHPDFDLAAALGCVLETGALIETSVRD